MTKVNLKNFLSMEQDDSTDLEIPEVVPVTNEEVIEAESDFDDYEQQVVEQEQEDMVVTEGSVQAERLMESMERYIEILEHGIETRQFSPQFAASVHVAMEEYNELMDIEVAAVSLEEYGHDDLGEFYELAPEDLTSKIYDVTSAVQTAPLRLISSIVGRGVEAGRSQAAKSIITRADSILNALPSGSGSVEISAKGLGKTIGVKGSVPSNVVSAASANLKSVEELTKVSIGVVGYLNGVADTLLKAVDQIRTKNSTGATDAIDQIARAKNPLDELSSGITDGSDLLGNKKIVVGDVPSVSPGPEWFAAHAKRKGPKLVKIKVGSSDGTISLSVQDIKSLLNSAKAQAVLLEKANREVTRALRGSKIKAFHESQVRLYNEGDLTRKFFRKNKSLQKARKYYTKQTTHLNALVKMTFRHGFESANALVRLAERAAKQIGNE